MYTCFNLWSASFTFVVRFTFPKFSLRDSENTLFDKKRTKIVIRSSMSLREILFSDVFSN
jgi:hypothetical protein